MDTPAVVTMLIGMVAIWGGLVASVVHAVRAHRDAGDPGRPDT